MSFTDFVISLTRGQYCRNTKIGENLEDEIGSYGRSSHLPMARLRWWRGLRNGELSVLLCHVGVSMYNEAACPVVNLCLEFGRL